MEKNGKRGKIVVCGKGGGGGGGGAGCFRVEWRPRLKKGGGGGVGIK